MTTCAPDRLSNVSLDRLAEHFAAVDVTLTYDAQHVYLTHGESGRTLPPFDRDDPAMAEHLLYTLGESAKYHALKSVEGREPAHV